MKKYTLSENYASALKNFLLNKLDQTQLATAAKSVAPVMEEATINSVLQFISQYPYAEVAEFFTAAQTEVKEYVEAAPAPETPENNEPEEISEITE